MSNTLLKVKRDCSYMEIRTFSREHGRKGTFYIDVADIERWLNNNKDDYFWCKDGTDLIRVWHDRDSHEFIIDIWWLFDSCGKVSGWHDALTVPCGKLRHLTDEWRKILCKDDVRAVWKLVWTETAQNTLKEIQKDEHIRRALCKTLSHGALQWPGRTVRLYADFEKNSFFFREDEGICGGLILHKNTGKYGTVYKYSVHT